MDTPRLDPQFVVDLKGKSYPLFAGVLDLAHQLGLVGIETELVQSPTGDNEQVAIVKATARMKDGSAFQGYGDASPKNTKLVTALIRIAETRAKGRALRDATNVGDCLLEELPDNETTADRITETHSRDKWGATPAPIVGAKQDPPPQRVVARYEPGTPEGDAAMAGGSRRPAQSGMTSLGDVAVTNCVICNKQMTAAQVTYCLAQKPPIDPPAHAHCLRGGA